MDTQEIGTEIPSALYLDLRLWMAEYLPCHVDQIERLDEMRLALALGCLEQACISMHMLVLMSRYVPGASPRTNDRVRAHGLALLPELIHVATEAGRWTDGDMRDCDVAGRAAVEWVRRETAKDRALATMEVAS